jgi:hypothetical protein
MSSEDTGVDDVVLLSFPSAVNDGADGIEEKVLLSLEGEAMADAVMDKDSLEGDSLEVQIPIVMLVRAWGGGGGGGMREGGMEHWGWREGREG